jgi:small-conductance mechanosensitive channel
VEYRQWDPFKSRLAAAILSGDAQNILWIVSFVFVLSFCVFWLVHSLSSMLAGTWFTCTRNLLTR